MSSSPSVQLNWKNILIAAVLIGAVATTVYVTQSSTAGSQRKLKKKKTRKSDASLEQVVPEAVAGEVVSDAKATVKTEEQALAAKNAGNQLYSQKKFQEAIAQYTTAIELSPNAVYFCNRAACYSNLKEFENAIGDCNEAIKLDPKYVKAFHRRGIAYENIGDLRAALNELTAVCALEGFKNQNSMVAPDRLLKTIATDRAKTIWETKVHTMPSETFIAAYMDSFRSTPSDANILADLVSDSASDVLLRNTYELARQRKWQDSLNSCSESISTDDFSAKTLKAKALNYRGTLNFLIGKVDEAILDLDASLVLDPTSVNTLIKRATLFMERGDLESTLAQFAKAEENSTSHPDLYYHRGQVKFLTGDFKGAVEDYATSLASEKEHEASVYVHIQMGVALYKLGDIAGSDTKFRESKTRFPLSAEVWNYHGEILMDKQSFADEMDPNSPLPYINKAILQMQWKSDSTAANTFCRKAIEVDPLCDIAFTQLAQLLCLQNELDEAILMYEKAVTIARTEAEIVNVIQCLEAAKAQKFVQGLDGLTMEW